MRESLSQQRQRISNKVELVRSDALAAVRRNGQSVSLRVDAKELQVEQAVRKPALWGWETMAGLLLRRSCV